MKEQYGDDKMKMQQAMMDLYKREKVNPLGGCLPILIQIPVFIAPIYWVLLGVVEMRGAPWLGWIQDLSVKDPYYILPLIAGRHQLHPDQAQPGSARSDPGQGHDDDADPVLPSCSCGSPPVWCCTGSSNNTLSIAQQWQINRMIDAGLAKAAE